MYATRTDGPLPHELILSLQRVLNIQEAEDDPLNALADDFNPVQVLNSYFPDEASLAKIESVQAKLAQDEEQLQREIDALHEQLRRDQNPRRMQLIQEMISDLLGQMSRIREKAAESEAVVRDITKDIQVLDLAKKNLILSMTTLKRLQMLVNALNQLEEQVAEKRYDEIVNSLGAVKEISATFKSYTSIQRISQIWRRIQEIQGDLRTKIDKDFEAFHMHTSASPSHQTLYAACLCADLLGPDVRAQLVDRYVALQLREYRRIFKATDEAGGLDNVERRFRWFGRVLQGHDAEAAGAWPEEWRVGWALVAKFVDFTREDMVGLLSKAGSALDVKLLLDTLQQTLDFEASMARKLGAPLKEILEASSPSSSRPIRPISSAFEPHLGVFVDAQDKAIANMLAPHLASKSAKPRLSIDTASASEHGDEAEAPPVVVLPSSTELFYVYRQSLEACAKLSTGKTLYDLGEVLKKWLRTYAEDVLIAGLKKPPTQPRKSTETRYDANELKNACMLINTADYCQRTAAELGETIREKINDDFKEKITFQAEQDIFVSVVSAAIAVLLRELEAACEPSFLTMTRTSWANLNQVSGQSPYVPDLVNAIEQVVDMVKPMVEQKKYFRNFLDKASSLILTRFTNALVKSRPLKEIGAEQLLIDLQAVKASLLKYAGDSSSSYARSVTKSTTRLEALLKVIVTPIDPADGFILNYILQIGDDSFSNFQKILDLKGTPKTEQNSLLDTFVTTTSTKRDLESTSFLSSLDMDPPAASQTASLMSPSGSRINLPSLLVGKDGLSGLGSPPLPSPVPSIESQPKPEGTPQKRDVFMDVRRLVSFGLRRDTAPPS
ncbi:hypothetical protein GLOTRDRAFT_137518 [Gloeophyllum trabeum ATCC 11539]|uniref:Uncharacterized protein n=1 Tax=Gloeophyllum trabeum (strain ATCC 11539 / FP-39264 / Madison 617) TaxID=670483 RepID=S7RV50_GLOTA|nr:uncharacterized protein GLOTRDRAFT_137518 [Gloeophyllum trabeum ATCC 11539]EPQ57099.1 hypothetical protein GLOTRDRAFT_137518 [Gloeophyllum trabeum ATCC 11539]